MKKLICECGNDQFISANYALAVYPPISVYFCSKCDKEHRISSSLPEERPTEVWVEDDRLDYEKVRMG